MFDSLSLSKYTCNVFLAVFKKCQGTEIRNTSVLKTYMYSHGLYHIETYQQMIFKFDYQCTACIRTYVNLA